MDNRYYDSVIEEMKPFLDEQGFSAESDGSFLNTKKSVKINYDEERQMYTLNIADVTDGNIGEYSEVSAWLFDDSQTAKDAASVGVDFTGTLRDNLGIRIKRSASSQNIDLPDAQKSGSITVSGFTKRVLDVFPQYKDFYKEHIAKYGDYLYLEFFSTTLVTQIGLILSENNKKQVKKLFELLEYGYIHGDKDTVNAIVACIAAAAYKDEKVKTAALEMLNENSHFKSSVENFIPVLSAKKKIKNALVK